MGQAARRIDCNGVSAMLCKFSMLRRKEVINLCDGSRLGFVGDLDIQVPEGTVKGIIVFGPCRFFGLFGRGEDFYVPWDCVQRFGDDIILIDKPFQRREEAVSEAAATAAPPEKGVVRVKNSASRLPEALFFLSYFLKLSFRDTLRSNTRCSAVQSRLSMQK